MVSRFSQTVWELGYSETKDIALLYRSMEAYALYTLATRAAKDLESITPEEVGLILPLQKALNKLEHKR